MSDRKLRTSVAVIRRTFISISYKGWVSCLGLIRWIQAPSSIHTPWIEGHRLYPFALSSSTCGLQFMIQDGCSSSSHYIKKKKKKFIYWLHWALVAARGLFAAVLGILSSCGARGLQSSGSVVVARGLSNALWYVGS